MEIKIEKLNPDPREILTEDETDDIYLTVEIGNGQIGGNKVTIEEKVTAKGNLSTPFFLGDVKSLQGKKIKLRTNVLDVNPYSNMCVITTTFKNQNNQVCYSKIDKSEAPDNGILSFIGNYMVKVLTICLLLLSGFTSSGQEIAFKNLEMPASPGLILLDQSPSAIEKPTTPQGVGICFLSLIQGGAIEFAPFWLKDHPKLTAEEMYKTHLPFLYNFSFSAASVNTDSGKYLAGGIRSRVFQKYDRNLLNQLNSLKADLENALGELDPEEPADTLLEKIEELKEKYQSLIERPVLYVDIAAAVSASAENNTIDDMTIARWSAWMSLNWRPKGNDFYISALSRYIYNENFSHYTNEAHLVDAGVRVNYDFKPFCISLEYLQRLNLTDKKYNDYRLAFVGSYKMSDNLFITCTLGKNYTGINNLITLLGVNFGFSQNKIKAFKEE